MKKLMVNVAVAIKKVVLMVMMVMMAVVVVMLILVKTSSTKIALLNFNHSLQLLAQALQHWSQQKSLSQLEVAGPATGQQAGQPRSIL